MSVHCTVIAAKSTEQMLMMSIGPRNMVLYHLIIKKRNIGHSQAILSAGSFEWVLASLFASVYVLCSSTVYSHT